MTAPIARAPFITWLAQQHADAPVGVRCSPVNNPFARYLHQLTGQRCWVTSYCVRVYTNDGPRQYPTPRWAQHALWRLRRGEGAIMVGEVRVVVERVAMGEVEHATT